MKRKILEYLSIFFFCFFAFWTVTLGLYGVTYLFSLILTLPMWLALGFSGFFCIVWAWAVFQEMEEVSDDLAKNTRYYVYEADGTPYYENGHLLEFKYKEHAVGYCDEHSELHLSTLSAIKRVNRENVLEMD